MKAGVTERSYPNLSYEAELWAAGHRRVAGIDEAGRGAWAGPVVAAAVVLPPDPQLLSPLLGRIDDSKRLSPAAREQLAPEIERHAQGVGIGSVPACEIDRIGILSATRLAMIQALACLHLPPDYLLLDFVTLPHVRQPQHGLPHGDALSLSIAAASILAKVARDRWMATQDALFPGYAFAHHKGYGTPEHQNALARLGPSALHRMSFQPLAQSAFANILSQAGRQASTPPVSKAKVRE